EKLKGKIIMKKTQLLVITIIASFTYVVSFANTIDTKFQGDQWCTPETPGLNASSGKQFCRRISPYIKRHAGKMTGCYPVHNGTQSDILTVSVPGTPDDWMVEPGCSVVVWSTGTAPSSVSFDIHDANSNCASNECNANDTSVANMVGLNAYGVNSNAENDPLETKPWKRRN
ncbi:MAG: hypothetical protein AAGA27_08405, partial [Pseudomonadota bacterium]